MARCLRSRFGFGALLALGLLPVPADAALAYRRQITILGAQVGATGAPHLNFPVLVSITDPTLKLVTSGGHITTALAYDIAFRDAGFALLDWEVERYDGVAGTLVAWVRIPSLPSGAGVNTIIYLDYGDCSVATPANTPANVWNAGYRYVYHLSETSGNPVDSTANAIVATRNPNADATAVETLNVSGKVGRAIDFTTAPTVPPAAFTVGPPATDTHVSIADGNYAAGTAFTMETWVKFDTVLGPGGFVGIMTKGRESGTNWIGIDRDGTGVASSIYQLPDGNVNGTTVLGAGTWYYVVATFNTSPQRRQIYVNGVQEGGDNTNSAFTTALNTRLGDDSNGNWLDGQMDEVRFSLGVTRSAGWILTSYNNQNNPATFFTLGAESSIAAVTSCGQTLVKSGVYVGNNTPGRPVFVGFQPDVVFVKRDAASYMVVRTSSMPADRTKSVDPAGVALFANGIQSFTAQGFTLGNDVQVNGAGGNYHWVAFQAAAGGLKVGTYTGNNTDDTPIPGVGFQPEYVITLPVVGGAAGTPLHRSSSMVGDTSYDFDATEVGPPANAIQALQADGFQIGTQASINTNLATYHYIAWNAVAGRMSVGSYVGNGLDNRDLDVVGFVPEWVLTKRTGDQRPWNHKPASTGINTNYSLTTSNVAGQADDIQALRPLGFQVSFGPEAFPDRTNDVGVTYHWIAFGPHRPQVNYRSIGTAANYSSFTVSATNGSTLVTGAGTAWKTANRGRGDRIQISGVDYVVAAVDTETQLQLTTPYAAATASGLGYTIARQFTTLVAWETCIDGNPCAFFPVASSSLIADDRSEVGIAYKDSVLSKLNINGSSTDATHTITLTADPGNRHLGVAGAGVVVDGGVASLANILVQDDFVTVEWIEIRGGVDEGIELQSLSTSPGPSNRIVLRYLLVHNTLKDGILIDDAAATADVYNNIVYQTASGGTAGIWVGTALTTGTVRLFNNTVYANASASGIRASGSNPSITLRNNLSLGNPSGDYNVAGRNAASSNNVASDATGTTNSPAGGGQNNVTATASPTVCGSGNCVGFSSITGGSENLHLIATTYTNRAVDTGADLSAVMAAFDIDAQLRVVPWDVGADDLAGTTAVKLQSFSAAAGDGSVALEWRTGSELDNLGFHLYRGVSEDGPWTRLTASLIPGLGSSAVGQVYSYRDVGLQNGTRYFYRLEDVDASSKTTSHGPVSAVPVAGAPGGAPGSEPPGSSPSVKKKGSASSSCPDWVVAAYGSSVGSDAATASLTCTRHGDPEAVGLEVLARNARSVTLELRTGGFYALHEAAGGVRVFVPGFDFPQDPQGAALPFRRALVDAVVGRRVELAGVRAWDQVGFRGLVPSTLGAAEMQVSWDGTVRAGRRAARATARGVRELEPRRSAQTDLARLQPSVFQGETKSAVVLISPLRYDARRQQLVLAKRVRVRLLFTGRETGESGRGRLGRRERPKKPVSGELLARLYTTSPGLYAVAFEQVFPRRARGVSASELRLERQGEPVSFHLEPAAGAFGPGSVVYFHAESAAASTDFSSEVAYELVRSRNGGQSMPLVSAAPAGDAVSSASLAQASFEVNRFYQPGLLAVPDLWLWEALASGATRGKSFSLAGVSGSGGGSGTAELDVFLQGASESGQAIDHHVSVSLNGTLLGESQFAGKQPYRMSLSVPVSLLHEGANELQLTNVADTGVSSFVFLDRFMLAHPQASLLAGGRFEGTWSESGTVTVSGVSGALAVLDVTPAGASGGGAGSAPRWLTGYSAAGGSLHFQAEAGHRYLAVAPQALLAPRVATPSVSTLRAVANQADYLLIAPRAFLSAAEPLLQRRQAQGLTARAVAFEEIADEFGHGRPSAEAIQGFLAYAFQSWSRPSPRYVLLLGDSTYDPRNFTGTSQPSPLPALWTKTSYLWTVSDPLLAAVNGEDALPDLAIGRLPATTVEQAQMLVEKLIAWEDSGQGLNGTATLVADNPDLAGDFEANIRDIAESYLAGRSELLLLSELGAQTRPRILDALNSGLSYLDYVGHGGGAVWASENVWNSWDAASLQAQSQQPLLVTMNCLNGYFVAPSYDSLAESLLKAEGRGAIAAFSPSGLSLDGPAHQYHRALMAELTSGRHERLGDAILAAQKAYAETGSMPELLSIYHLFGDPATRIH